MFGVSSIHSKLQYVVYTSRESQNSTKPLFLSPLYLPLKALCKCLYTIQNNTIQNLGVVFKKLISFYLLKKMLRYVGILFLVEFSKYLESFIMIWPRIRYTWHKQFGLVFIESPCSSQQSSNAIATVYFFSWKFISLFRNRFKHYQKLTLIPGQYLWVVRDPFNLRATKGVVPTPPKVFSMSHFLHLE